LLSQLCDEMVIPQGVADEISLGGYRTHLGSISTHFGSLVKLQQSGCFSTLESKIPGFCLDLFVSPQFPTRNRGSERHCDRGIRDLKWFL
jgi:hypothetical protein